MVQKVKVINFEFSNCIEQSVNRLSMPKNIYVEGYLVRLLSEFVKKGDDFLSDRPLIFRFLDSKSLEDYVKLGDETLFMTGFFPEIFLKDKRKGYVISIGKDSYIHAAIKLNCEGKGHIYKVLSKKFEKYSDVLNDVRYNMLETINDQEFLGLYKLWQNYNDQRALEKLKEEGIAIE